MKLSLTLHGKTYSVESDDAFDGTDVYDLAEQFKGLLVNAGFHPSNVDEIFNLDYQWFTDEENEGNMQGHSTHSDKYHEQLEKVRDVEAEERMRKRIDEFQNNMYK
jgi:Tat protein secretion system quality control protein TatD with DNase activity